MAEEKKTRKSGSGTKPSAGSTSKEKSIKLCLKDIVGTDTKVYYIMFKYCPEYLPKQIKTFKDLTEYYAVFTDKITEEVCEKYLFEENCQVAITWLLKRLHHKKMVELYNLYFEKAKDDVQSFRAFQDFSKEFFKESKQSDLTMLLNRIPDKEISLADEEEEDLSYTYEE